MHEEKDEDEYLQKIYYNTDCIIEEEPFELKMPLNFNLLTL